MRWLTLCLIAIIIGCSTDKQVPKGILEPDVMQKVVYDLLRADEFLANYKYKDTALNKRVEATKMYAQIFRIHGVTKEVFFKSYSYYQEHPDINKVMFDSLYNKANRRKIDSVLPAAVNKQ